MAPCRGTDANGQGKLYIDGALDETDFTYFTYTRATTTLNRTALGALLRADVVAATYLSGDIDEVATWTRALTWTEIQEIRTSGVPIPQGITPPSITVQPLDRTNNVFAGDDLTFSVQVDGTFPMSFQWLKGASAISGALNPSAITDTLTLTNVQVLLCHDHQCLKLGDQQRGALVRDSVDAAHQRRDFETGCGSDRNQ